MIITNELVYRDEDTVCRGFIAYNPAFSSPVSAVMVAPDWGGRGKDACEKAKKFAALGYVGFAIDMYGQALTASAKDEKRALMSPLMNDRNRLVKRIKAAFDALIQLPQVDKKNIAAIGYCFGGLCVLDLARSGSNVNAVISVHGLLSAASEPPFKPIKSKILVLHGYDDPLVKPEQVNQFAHEMTKRNVDWQIHIYGLTAHSFTNPLANDNEMGLHYNARSDRRSWQSTIAFLQEVFNA
ncbi:dienelactone hydrolase family protein [Legionella sp.]|uniref:dienelactone hydrolase family protein n=1 Tax=Legionella sp. TaxID=459 RepID=UPI003CA3D24E